MDLIARQQIAKRVDAALEGEEYSVIEMAYDLQRLATHPVWEQAERCAVELEGAIEALRKVATGSAVTDVRGIAWMELRRQGVDIYNRSGR